MNTRQATEGMWLTQATLEDETARTFFRECAGFGDLDELFIEVSNEYKQEWEEEHPQEELLNAEEVE
jgi:hypothetical protein